MSVELPNSSQINISVWEQCVRALQNPEDIMPNKASLLFLLDDNFYYPSMRYEVCQLARKYSIGFCQVHLQCDLESCISRNQKRPQPIPTEVILDMAKRLEAPNPQKNSWELYSISLNTTENVSEFDLQRVMELISTALNNPLSPVEDNAEQKEADRVKCASSVVHQADQACRRLISEAMKTARENRVSSDHMRILASQLNESKAAFLQNLRKQLLQDVNLIHQEDIDVEHTVKRAMDIFNDQKKQILLGIINKHP
ncbi:L-seryl-tRNA(Sec) kinase isoform 2-T2 [Pholidichthys leucotaenia]